jgi:hypothetical protein
MIPVTTSDLAPMVQYLQAEPRTIAEVAATFYMVERSAYLWLARIENSLGLTISHGNIGKKKLYWIRGAAC